MKALLWPNPVQFEQPAVYVCSMHRQNQLSREMVRGILLFIGIVVGLLIISNQSNAQKNSFIYGKVTTISGDVYTGPIRWGSKNAQKAEVFWVEVFNGTKTSNDLLKYLSKSEIEELSQGEESGGSWLNIDLGVLSIWADKFTDTPHEFKARFGDLKSIEPVKRDRAMVTFKNGTSMEIKAGNSEDIGGSIGVYDFELGEVMLSWGRVEKVEFMASPKTQEEGFGKPIYGVVNAGRKGTFKGQIEWDSDERFLEEVLDGKDRDGDKKVPFRSIQKIVKQRNGVDLTLKSGRSLYLTGSNDVNNENRGIVVNDPDVGQVKIAWRDFIELNISDDESLRMSYDDFLPSRGLNAKVITIQGDEYDGLIAFDLDEAYEFELLDANDDEAEFQIVFRNIKSIIPKNYNYSMVELKNGERLLLGDHRDVSENNAGVLVFPSKNAEPIYIKWSKIDEIIFD
ncbi:hypothetical protein [Roseivirga misakiensis]|uniref:Uncharacterized protein n=1 Tax=Roseivirga misakiensis TaxID=1563681 RepID=A0A1E5T6W3_9BACT|nr:hypothetical protein [Roseivirga misakiensis]OEK07103.1 hypothetical protein BFP71_05450 [Roseivirga misakiensis]